MARSRAINGRLSTKLRTEAVEKLRPVLFFFGSARCTDQGFSEFGTYRVCVNRADLGRRWVVSETSGR